MQRKGRLRRVWRVPPRQCAAALPEASENFSAESDSGCAVILVVPSCGEGKRRESSEGSKLS